MAVVVAAVVRSGCTFSGGAAASVVDDVGGGRDGVTRPFGYRAVMIARACIASRFGMVGPICQRQARSPAVNAHNVRGFGTAAPPDL
jgi:hypothetical protein